MEKKFNYFHLVRIRPWPLISSFGVLNLIISFILWMGEHIVRFAFLSIFLLFLISELWWRDVERESTGMGDHRYFVKFGLKLGILLFILSEIMFFLSFFWSFIHASRSSDIELGSNWPPLQIFPFDPLRVPLANTIILLSSGASITWCHHLVLKKRFLSSLFSLFLTIYLGIFFTMLQGIEYIRAPYSIRDRAIGSTFFISTGFHGVHVLVGTTFLFVVFLKFFFIHNTTLQNVGFECSAWYWHFVDVVWLFLYRLIYWWGG